MWRSAGGSSGLEVGQELTDEERGQNLESGVRARNHGVAIEKTLEVCLKQK